MRTMDFFNRLPQIRYMAGIMYQPQWAEFFHESGNHEFLHVLSGHIKLIFQDGKNQREYFACRGESLIVPAGSLHKDVFDIKEELKVLYVNFSWDAAGFFNCFNNSHLSRLSEETIMEIRMIAGRMRYDSVHAGSGKAMENARLLNILLLIWQDLYANSEDLPQKQEQKQMEKGKSKTAFSPAVLAGNAKKYVDSNFASPLYLEDVAKHLGISKYHLSRLFHDTTGFSFQEYLSIVRLQEAKKILADEKCRISEIAQKCGFDNGNYFSKVFRKKFGITPGEFREQEILKSLKEYNSLPEETLHKLSTCAQRSSQRHSPGASDLCP